MYTYPVNQVFLGGDRHPNQNVDLDTQIQALKAYEEKLQDIKNRSTNTKKENSLWDDIDNELAQLNDEQRNVLFSDASYIDISSKLQGIVQMHILNLVKDKICVTQEGKELLSSQLELVKKLKSSIIEESNREIELFKKFRKFSKNNPGVTYEEFIKSNM